MKMFGTVRFTTTTDQKRLQATTAPVCAVAAGAGEVQSKDAWCNVGEMRGTCRRVGFTKTQNALRIWNQGSCSRCHLELLSFKFFPFAFRHRSTLRLLYKWVSISTTQKQKKATKNKALTDASLWSCFLLAQMQNTQNMTCSNKCIRGSERKALKGMGGDKGHQDNKKNE